jgi:putative tryptophan/tyrosine transport system substrate-binding protein
MTHASAKNGLFPSDCSFPFILLLFLSIILILQGTGLCTEGQKPKKILIVSSYEPDQVTGKPQLDGIIHALDKEGFQDSRNLQVQHFFMDTLRTYTDREQIEERGRLALEKIQEFVPDLVITIDDNAARTVMLPLAGSAIPVVFTGMNQQPEYYNQTKKFMATREEPGGNVTGVYEKLHIAKALEVMHSIIGLHKVVFIYDSSPTGNAFRTQIDKEIAGISSTMSTEHCQVKTFEELKEKIKAINLDPDVGAIYPLLTTLKTANNTNVATREILTWVFANSTKPEMAGNNFYSQLGMFGGAVVNFDAMGKQAGRQAAAILKGKPAGSIPIADAGEQSIVFNLERARQLGITIPMDILSAADILYDIVELKPSELVNPGLISLLIIQSYEKGVGCGATIEVGLLEGLAQAGYQNGKQLELHHFYMDGQETHITEEAILKQAQLALAEVDRLKPRIIVLLDDNAFEHVLPALTGSSTPVFFAGTNVPLEYYNRLHPFMESRQYPGKNVTGVTEEHALLQTLNLITTIIPKAKTAVTIYSDSTPFARRMAEANEAYIAKHRESFPLRFLPPAKVTKLSEYQALIKKYDNDPSVDIIYTFNTVSLVRDDGTISPIKETIKWMADNQKKPDFTWMNNWVEAGYLASAGIDIKETGQRLADKIVKVLAGSKPGDLPIENPGKYAITLNLDRAKKLNLEIPVDILEAADIIYAKKNIHP